MIVKQNPADEDPDPSAAQQNSASASVSSNGAEAEADAEDEDGDTVMAGAGSTIHVPKGFPLPVEAAKKINKNRRTYKYTTGKSNCVHCVSA